MDPRLVEHFERELRHVREMRREFAGRFPKVAGRLSIEGLQCDDPYVERLTESFAFLAARVQMEVEQSFPAFAQAMLEVLCPACLSPVPSAAVVQLRPDAQDQGVATGYTLPRGRLMRSAGASGETRCQWRVAHDMQLWPLRLDAAAYFTARDLGSLGLPPSLTIADPGGGQRRRVRAALKLTISSSGPPLAALAAAGLDRLPIYLPGTDDAAGAQRIWGHLVRHGGPLVVRAPGRHDAVRVVERGVARFGFDPDQAMVPPGPHLAEPHRLILEYLMLPERFRFVELRGLRRAIAAACAPAQGDEEGGPQSVELILPLWAEEPQLERGLDVNDFALFCTPVVNLFPQETGRQKLTDLRAELPIIVDRARPLDHEVWRVDSVQAYAGGAEATANYVPMFEPTDLADASDDEANADAATAAAVLRERHFTYRRLPRRPTDRELADGSMRSRYAGTEVLVTLGPDPRGEDEAIKQIGATVWCTNRDLPLGVSLSGERALSLMQGEPVESIACLSGSPTAPRLGPAWAGEDSLDAGDATDGLPTAWRLVNALGLNHVPLAGRGGRRAAKPLRTLLRLLGGGEASAQQAARSVLRVAAEPVARRTRASNGDFEGFARGLRVTLDLEDSPPPPGGTVMLGAVLEQVLTRTVAINSFVETIVRSPTGGTLSHFRPLPGRRYIA